MSKSAQGPVEPKEEYTGKLGDWKEVRHDQCNGKDERCKKGSTECKTWVCKCACCPPRRGIITFFGIIMALLVIGIIMYFLAWTSIPDFETFRDYWKNGMPSTHFKK